MKVNRYIPLLIICAGVQSGTALIVRIDGPISFKRWDIVEYKAEHRRSSNKALCEEVGEKHSWKINETGSYVLAPCLTSQSCVIAFDEKNYKGVYPYGFALYCDVTCGADSGSGAKGVFCYH